MTSVVTTSGRLVEIQTIAPGLFDRMFALQARHFAGVSRARFDADAADKTHAILIDREKDLLGFSTIRAYEASVDGEVVSVIYSGDTIVDPRAWNTPTLARTWIESVAAIRQKMPNGRLFWLLITSGFRTYRLLPTFWREYVPSARGSAPVKMIRLMRALAADRFGSQFNAATGIVRFREPQVLRGHLAGIPAGRRDDEDVRFFNAINPGHASGDELVCLAELSPANLTPAGRRMARSVPTW